VKAYVGISVRVNVGAQGFIERSIGKAKRVIDKRSMPAG
jgi:phenylacetate-coenzyme A ligase PaaK-like adenylate-forming protein